jgi:hypothetical protein
VGGLCWLRRLWLAGMPGFGWLEIKGQSFGIGIVCAVLAVHFIGKVGISIIM